jgi:hypothetical protein
MLFRSIRKALLAGSLVAMTIPAIAASNGNTVKQFYQAFAFHFGPIFTGRQMACIWNAFDEC